ncbi:MAG: polyprenyl synthetase family protein [Legionellaceae bacterium]|nr:polyprenyl synthetase family protein [Legionellaceae bacterium]
MTSHFSEYQAHFERYLQSQLKDLSFPSKTLQKAVQYVMTSGGKRVRPLLVYLVGEAAGISLDIRNVLALSVELIHNYSLVHDDLPSMDNDDYRRGRLSCHKAFQEATAILVGDGLQCLALEYLLKALSAQLSAENIVQMMHTLLHASGFSGMVSGQALDLENQIQEISDLENIHQLKTGALFQASVELPLLAPNKLTAAQKQGLRSFAKKIGLAFQMQDDYLDSYAPEDTLGKNRKSDEANDKITYSQWYSESELRTLILQQFQSAKEVLSPLESAALPLQDFVDYLQWFSVK